MKTIRRVLGLILGLVVGVGLVIFVAGRSSDGPLGFFSGGAFASGEAMEAIDDWSFARDVETVELQLLEPARSRTVWLIVAGGGGGGAAPAPEDPYKRTGGDPLAGLRAPFRLPKLPATNG